MRGNAWTPEEIAVVMEHKDSMTCGEIAELLPRRTKNAVMSYCKKNGIVKGDAARNRIIKTLKIFTEEQYKFFLEIYRGRTSEDTAKLMEEKFGIPFDEKKIYTFRHNHKLPSGVKTTFQKGSPSTNKGKHWDDFLSKEAQEHIRNTSCYKPGTVPKNWMPVGTILKKSNGYMYIKVSDRKDVKHPGENWKLLHYYNWEKVNGPVKEGMILVFLDGDVTNCDVSNLREISREAHGYAKEFRSLGKELFEVCLDAGQLKAKAKAKAKEIKDAKD